MMQLGVDGVFVGSGIFKSGDPAKRAAAIVQATTYFNDPLKIAEVSENLGQPMVGIGAAMLLCILLLLLCCIVLAFLGRI